MGLSAGRFYIDRFQQDLPPAQIRYQLDGGQLSVMDSEKPSLMSLSGQFPGFTNIVSVCSRPLRVIEQSRASWRDHIMDGCLARIFLSQFKRNQDGRVALGNDRGK